MRRVRVPSRWGLAAFLLFASILRCEIMLMLRGALRTREWVPGPTEQNGSIGLSMEMIWNSNPKVALVPQVAALGWFTTQDSKNWDPESVDELARPGHPILPADGDYLCCVRGLRNGGPGRERTRTVKWRRRCPVSAGVVERPSRSTFVSSSSSYCGHSTWANASWLWMLSWFSAWTRNQATLESSRRMRAAFRTMSSTKAGFS